MRYAPWMEGERAPACGTAELRGTTETAVHFDDRLATVLHHRAAGARAACVQFRQLLDLLGGADNGIDPSLVRAAYRRLDSLVPMIPVAQRERIAAECSPRIRNPLLLAWFASAEPRVALAALSRAALDAAQWTALIPALPVQARGLLRHRRNLPRSAQILLDRLGVRDRVLPEPADAAIVASPVVGAARAADDAPALDLGSYAEEGYVFAESETLDPASGARAPGLPDAANLGALLRRIETFQRARAHRRDSVRGEAPQLPLDESPEERRARPPLAAFLFTTDEAGRVDWAEPLAAPQIVGSNLAPVGARPVSDFARGFAERLPVAGALVELAGGEQIAGHWMVDAAPRFARHGGRFTGYVGRFRRRGPSAADNHATRAADRVRQLLHELRTPVTAIQGFAEVIQQQTVGPVPHEYRALAAEIAGDAARMLAGFAEIERLARLEAGMQDLPEGTSDLAALVRRQVAQLQTVLSPRVSRIDASFALETATVPLASETAEAIAWRFLGTLASAIAAGEKMALNLDASGDSVRLVARVPAAMAHVPDVFAADMHPAGGALGMSLLGAGFALRLARAEARACGGDLVREGTGTMILTLPLGEAVDVPGERPERANLREPAEPQSPPLAQSPRAR